MSLTLGKVIRNLLCDVARGDYEKCKCDRELGVRSYYCVYGDCEIITCNKCHRIVKVIRGRCYYPDSKN